MTHTAVGIYDGSVIKTQLRNKVKLENMWAPLDSTYKLRRVKGTTRAWKSYFRGPDKKKWL